MSLVLSRLFLISCFLVISFASFSQVFSQAGVVTVPALFGNFSRGDYDHDGDEDILVTGQQWNSRILKLFMTQSGAITERTDTGLPDWASSAEWIDYDGDQDLDIFVVQNHSTKTVADFYINTNGFFKRLGVELPILRNTHYSLADFDNDHDVDILMVGAQGFNDKTYLLKNSNNVFFPISSPIQGTFDSHFGWADIDKDDDLDVLVTNFSSSLLYINNGNGAFSEFSRKFPAHIHIQWEDFDQDNDLDLFTAGADIKIYINNGDKTFSELTLNLPNAGGPGNQWIDFDKDGDFDIVHCFYENGAYATNLYEYKDGHYAKVSNLGLPGCDNIIFIDYDKDQDFDAFIPNDRLQATLFRNNANTNPYSLSNTPGWPTALTAHADKATEINLDWNDWTQNEDFFSIEMQAGASGTFQEIGVASANTGYYVVKNLSPGTEYKFRVRAGNVSGYSRYSDIVKARTASSDFLKLPSLPALGFLCSSSWADIDNDRDLDLIYSGIESSLGGYRPKTYIVRNDAGAFNIQPHSLPDIAAFDLDWADYDHDGDLDLLMSGTPPDASNALTKLLVNKGNFVFEEHTNTSFGGVRSGFARWVDMNSDGYMDVYLSGTADSNNTIHICQTWINRKDNIFEQIFDTGLPNVYQSEMEAADFDEDGRTDIAVIGVIDSSDYYVVVSEVYLNKGDNKFRLSQRLKPSADTAVESADFDLDGDLDLIIAGTIYLNDKGNFTEDKRNDLFKFVYGRIVLGDLDNDGDTDIILGGEGSTATFKSRSYINDGTGVFSEGNIPLLRIRENRYAIGDYDRDGDLDFFEGGYFYDYFAEIVRNQWPTQNLKPNAPTIKKVQPVAGGIALKWENGADDKTASRSLTSNAYLKDASGKYWYNSYADMATGTLKKPSMGNAYMRDSIVFRGLIPGTYEVGVQNIDASFSASSFTSATVTVDFVAPTLVRNRGTCYNSQAEIEILCNSILWYNSEALVQSIGTGSIFRPSIRKNDSTFYAVQQQGTSRSAPLKVVVKAFRPVTDPITISGNTLVAPIADSYQWFKNDTLLVSRERVVQLSGLGVYRLKAAKGGCVVDTITYISRPGKPQVSQPKPICIDNPQSLTATGANIKWYDKKHNLVGIGTTYKVDKATMSDTVVFATQMVQSIQGNSAHAGWPVYPYPDTDVIQEGSIFIASKALSYQWYYNNEPLKDEVGQRLEVSGDGEYYVEAFNLGCKTLSEKINFTSTEESISDWKIAHAIHDEVLYIMCGTHKVHSCKLYDVTGKLLTTILNPEKSGNEYRISTKRLAPGLYFVKVAAGTRVAQGRFVKIE